MEDVEGDDGDDIEDFEDIDDDKMDDIEADEPVESAEDMTVAESEDNVIDDESAEDMMDGDIDVDELVEHELEDNEEELEEIEEKLEEMEEIREEMDEVREEEENEAGFKRGNSVHKGKGREQVLNGGRANGVEPTASASEYLNVVYLGIGMAYTKKEEKFVVLRDSDFVPATSYGTSL